MPYPSRSPFRISAVLATVAALGLPLPANDVLVRNLSSAKWHLDPIPAWLAIPALGLGSAAPDAPSEAKPGNPRSRILDGPCSAESLCLLPDRQFKFTPGDEAKADGKGRFYRLVDANGRVDAALRVITRQEPSGLRLEIQCLPVPGQEALLPGTVRTIGTDRLEVNRNGWAVVPGQPASSALGPEDKGTLRTTVSLQVQVSEPCGDAEGDDEIPEAWLVGSRAGSADLPVAIRESSGAIVD